MADAEAVASDGADRSFAVADLNRTVSDGGAPGGRTAPRMGNGHIDVNESLSEFLSTAPEAPVPGNGFYFSLLSGLMSR